MSSISEALIKNLIEIKAVKLSPKNPFTWASGMRSPIYCDNRVTLSYPHVRDLIIDGFLELCKKIEDFDIVVGVATAGIPHGALLANALNKPFAYVRSKPKEHGRKNQIEGQITAGQKALVVEDLVSTGKSSLSAISALIQEDIEITATVAIFTYGFEAAFNNFKEAKIPLYTISNYEELIIKAEESNYITNEESLILRNWNQDPKNWFNKNFN